MTHHHSFDHVVINLSTQLQPHIITCHSETFSMGWQRLGGKTKGSAQVEMMSGWRSLIFAGVDPKLDVQVLAGHQCLSLSQQQQCNKLLHVCAEASPTLHVSQVLKRFIKMQPGGNKLLEVHSFNMLSKTWSLSLSPVPAYLPGHSHIHTSFGKAPDITQLVSHMCTGAAVNNMPGQIAQ